MKLEVSRNSPIICSVSYGLGEGYSCLRDDVQEWCDKNLNKWNPVRVNYCISERNGEWEGYYILEFYNERDAFLFKTWWL
jgi:hypothetical protein